MTELGSAIHDLCVAKERRLSCFDAQTSMALFDKGFITICVAVSKSKLV